jgi:hypothetical protein
MADPPRTVRELANRFVTKIEELESSSC